MCSQLPEGAGEKTHKLSQQKTADSFNSLPSCLIGKCSQVFPKMSKKTEMRQKWFRQLIDTSQLNGAPGGIRTPDPLLRRQTLFPTELRARGTEWPQFTVLAAWFATNNWGRAG